MIPLASLLLAVSCWATFAGAVTVYGLEGSVAPGHPTATTTSDTAAGTVVNIPLNYSGYEAFNPIILAPPPVPSANNTLSQFDIVLESDPLQVTNLSIKQSGWFYGFSIEMSVVPEVIGRNSSIINVPFLNLMALIVERVGRVNVRIGGSSQDFATQVPSLPAMEEERCLAVVADIESTSDETAILEFTPDLIYMMSNVSALVNVYWYLGIPFNDTSDWRLQIAETSEAVLGDFLIGFQVGDEPDLYGKNGIRPVDYAPLNYYDEFGELVSAIQQDPNIPTRDNLITPSIAGAWKPEDVWDTGLYDTYYDEIYALSVQHYPWSNCAAMFPLGDFGPVVVAQDVFPAFLNHTAVQFMNKRFLNTTLVAQTVDKPLLMFETNTASCGGFPGISDSFGAALWATDFGLYLAYSNFSGANLMTAGLDSSFNLFTPPPGNMSQFEQWSIAPIFYSTIVVAEALGATGTAQVVDLKANDENIYTPAYAIYELGQLARVVLINYVTDPTGGSTYTASISANGAQMPKQVAVKYLLAPSVSSKENVTWAGQTLGPRFKGDGRMMGDEVVKLVKCDQSSNTCDITVPAPAVAVVFLTQTAYDESNPETTMTFSTTVLTDAITVSVNPTVLATSDGNKSFGAIGSSDDEWLYAQQQAAARGSGGERVRAAVGVVVAAGMVLVSMVWTGLR